MNTPALTGRELSLIADVFRRHPEIASARLFGSRAKGNSTPRSDVDLAVGGDIDALEAEAIAAELDELPLPYRFDVKPFGLIRLRTLREEIERVGIPVYPEPPTLRAERRGSGGGAGNHSALSNGSNSNRKANEPMSDEPMPNSEIILYQTEDGRTRVQVRLQDETVWLTQKLMAELFQTSVPNVSMHIRNVFAEGELRADSVVKEFLTTAADGKSYGTQYYNLDVIISVGYRVKSLRGTQFRIWATQRLREYIVKGFTMDDERLKNPPGKGQKDYFDEQLERIRDIRSSERRFYQKVLDIYATSVDYSPSTQMSQQFFATVQNKMHWAAHGQTAAEVIHARVDAQKPFMGLQTTRPGGIVRREDVSIAKNYLDGEELGTLNRIVNAYIEFAELRALQRKAMTMRDWIAKLDEFLGLSEHELLDHAGKISAEQAKMKAELEYDRYRVLLDSQPRAVDLDFDKAVSELKRLQKPKKPKLPKT